MRFPFLGAYGGSPTGEFSHLLALGLSLKRLVVACLLTVVRLNESIRNTLEQTSNCLFLSRVSIGDALADGGLRLTCSGQRFRHVCSAQNQIN